MMKGGGLRGGEKYVRIIMGYSIQMKNEKCVKDEKQWLYPLHCNYIP